MENESNTFPKAKSNRWIWIFLASAGLCAALVCCILISVSGVSLLLSYRSNNTAVSESRMVPTEQTSPGIPPVATGTPIVKVLPELDYEAVPLFGSANLQRGFSPDPYVVDVLAGGSVNTSDFELNCGFISTAPSFAFHLSGGASDGFLRIFFDNIGEVDTTLVVHTPDQGWFCVDDSSYGSGKTPVIDIESAASGNYAVWVGQWDSNIFGLGSLYITQSAHTVP